MIFTSKLLLMLVKRMNKYHIMSLVGLELAVSHLQAESANHSLTYIQTYVHTHMALEKYDMCRVPSGGSRIFRRGGGGGGGGGHIMEVHGEISMRLHTKKIFYPAMPTFPNHTLLGKLHPLDT